MANPAERGTGKPLNFLPGTAARGLHSQPAMSPEGVSPLFPSEGSLAAERYAGAPRPGAENFFGAGGFQEVLSALNPLQHLPLIGTLYRAITGDTLSPGARLAGGVLYGGPIGLVSAVFNNIVEEASGRDVGANMLALLDDGPAEGAPTPLLAAAEPATGRLAAVAALAPAGGTPPAAPPKPTLAEGKPADLTPEAMDALLRSVGAQQPGAASPGRTEPRVFAAHGGTGKAAGGSGVVPAFGPPALYRLAGTSSQAIAEQSERRAAALDLNRQMKNYIDARNLASPSAVR